MKWSYIMFLPAVVSWFWALATVILKRHMTRAQLLMSLTLFAEGFAMMVLGIFFRDRVGSLFIYDFLFESTVVICGPMFYMAVCSLTEPRGVTLAQRRVFIIPLLFILGLTVGAFLIGPRRYEEMCRLLIANESHFIPGDASWNYMYFWYHYLFPILTIVMSFILLIISTVKMNRFRKRFNSYYASNMQAPPIDIKPLIVLTWCFPVIASVIVYAIDMYPPYYKYWIIVCCVLLTVLQFVFGRFVYRCDHDARSLADYIRAQTNTNALIH